MAEHSDACDVPDRPKSSHADTSTHTFTLSTKICSHLPREIRNKIYSHLSLDKETKHVKRIDHFTSPQFCFQFSRECLFGYYENVPQMLYHPFITDDIEYFMQCCTGAKKIPGLTIIVEGTRTEYELGLLTKAVDRLKATGYLDDIDRAFKVRVYIDMAQNPCWRSVNPEIETAVKTIQPILQFFKERTESVRCFARLMHIDDKEAREDGLDVTEHMEKPMDEILNCLGLFQYVAIGPVISEEKRKARQAAEKRKKLLEAR
ncbi:uncharacterized protein CC84DRAFT_1257704 [Paraphaeosphaeria sporulosa]|uniref:Uncharacterized protein n=1 Tax=Paraphaeosphaeria sporulosa TaxID=1460663 RepID=A0A177CN82_9PLEO|nr:uncharacterized protein CC84DRAFT_1257704 [Paraphaeosphaeria sporulosa]OAG08964.1 hypothetical protein CC84DRAFT_1257704 [Paraphaeosphaeria sporulosa]